MYCGESQCFRCNFSALFEHVEFSVKLTAARAHRPCDPWNCWRNCFRYYSFRSVKAAQWLHAFCVHNVLKLQIILIQCPISRSIISIEPFKFVDCIFPLFLVRLIESKMITSHRPIARNALESPFKNHPRAN